MKELPIGSIVVLKNNVEKVMIYDRKLKVSGQGFDYIACGYSENKQNEQVQFSEEQIETIVFKGDLCY